MSKTTSPFRWYLLFAGLLALVAIIGGCMPLVPPAVPTRTASATPTAAEHAVAVVTELPSATPTRQPTATSTPRPTATKTPRPTATATPASRQFTLVLTEEQLNKMVTDAISKNPNLRITNPALDLRPGLLVLSGRTAVGFLNVNFEISASVPVRDGRPQPQVEEVKVNGAAVGGFLRDQIAAMVQPYLNNFAQTDLGATIESVQITDTEVTITGQRQ